MTDPLEDDLRRALDDVLATCWADEIPILDALAEAVTDWTAQVEAEFNESKAFEPGTQTQELAEALAAMEAAVDQVGGTIPIRVFAVALTEALRDWSAVGDTVGRDLERSFSARSLCCEVTAHTSGPDRMLGYESTNMLKAVQHVGQCGQVSRKVGSHDRVPRARSQWRDESARRR